jgi:hypothetical protein
MLQYSVVLGRDSQAVSCHIGSTVTTSAAYGTLYDDWLARRARLREYHGEREPIVAVQLRVLDYLIDRYRDDAAALEPAAPPLDVVYVNERAIIVNQGSAIGLVAGVKSAHEAADRVAAIMARMQQPAEETDESDDLPGGRAGGWSEWNQPSDGALRRLWKEELARFRRGRLDLKVLCGQVEGTPFLPIEILEYVYGLVARSDYEDDALTTLARCRNRLALTLSVQAWRKRLAHLWNDAATAALRETIVDSGHRAVDEVRCLLADEIAEVRIAAAEVLAEIGSLRDIGIISDLLSMPTLSDEATDERLVLAHAMEKLAKRLDEDR